MFTEQKRNKILYFPFIDVLQKENKWTLVYMSKFFIHITYTSTYYVLKILLTFICLKRNFYKKIEWNSYKMKCIYTLNIFIFYENYSIVILSPFIKNHLFFILQVFMLFLLHNIYNRKYICRKVLADLTYCSKVMV